MIYSSDAFETELIRTRRDERQALEPIIYEVSPSEWKQIIKAEIDPNSAMTFDGPYFPELWSLGAQPKPVPLSERLPHIQQWILGILPYSQMTRYQAHLRYYES